MARRRSPAHRRPTFHEEQALALRDYTRAAGVDEVGRGPIAGPVLAAAVVLPIDASAPWAALLRDSKLLSAAQRERAYAAIERCAVAVGVGLVETDRLDELGIAAACRLAMRQAIERLDPAPDFVLTDNVRLPDLRVPYRAVPDGDTVCASIAAASIVAKVTRDRLMVDYARQFPGYGFERHKGYGTSAHLAILQALGPCPIHRRSFAPVQT
ncbi:MAG: ribonuclease HII, partial [Chloroflexi bacterium]|nr:ribonuclease HII [Chloroflexota bacterium]